MFRKTASRSACPPSSSRVVNNRKQASPVTPADKSSRYGVVAIGRNEGERLKQCLISAQGADAIVYVDSGSTDGSVAWAKGRGVEVVELDMKTGFTAARARNAGFRR